MAITVPFDLHYDVGVPASPTQAFALLADVPASARHFPQLERLVPLGGGAWRWEMEKLGNAQMSLQTIYASTYVADPAAGTVVWTPIRGEGNASVGGSWTVRAQGDGSQVALHIHGDLLVPLPGIMKSVITPVVQDKNRQVVEAYLASLVRELGGSAPGLPA